MGIGIVGKVVAVIIEGMIVDVSIEVVVPNGAVDGVSM